MTGHLSELFDAHQFLKEGNWVTQFLPNPAKPAAFRAASKEQNFPLRNLKKMTTNIESSVDGTLEGSNERNEIKRHDGVNNHLNLDDLDSRPAPVRWGAGPAGL